MFKVYVSTCEDNGKVKDNRKQNFNIKEYFNEIDRGRV